MTCRVAKIHCLGVLLLTLAAVAGPVMAASDVLTLGRISDDPRNHYGQLKPLLDYIVPRMQDLGIRQGRVLMARDVRQMANYLRRGSVDWVTETPGMAMELRNLAGAQPLLLTERNGSASYRSYIIVRRDSGIRDLAGLTGRSIAFEYVASTSAYLVPVSELLQAGLPLDPLTAIGDTPRNGAVGYLFSRSETNTAMWVAKGLVSAGAISSLGWENPRILPPSVRGELVVIHESGPMPRGLELVRPDLDARVRERLRELLQAAADDPQAAEAMQQFFGASRFLPLDAGHEAQLRRLAESLVRVHREVE
jgi:phosphonate transport system substrate-binding protein